MKLTTAFMLFLATMFASVARAQTTVTVNATGTFFVDVMSGTNVTTIQLGDTVRWVRLNVSHTATSGTGPSDPANGALFNFNLNATTPIATFTPTSVGTIQYYCSPHFAFGMTGTIIVQPPPLYPGTNEDFIMGTAVNTPGGPTNPITFGGGVDVKNAHAGDLLTVQARSVAATFNYKPLLIVGQAFTTGQPTPPGALPGIHINTSGGFLIMNGLDPSALGTIQLIVPGGSTYGYGIPVGLTGQSLMIQCLAIAGNAANGIYAASTAHEIRFL